MVSDGEEFRSVRIRQNNVSEAWSHRRWKSKRLSGYGGHQYWSPSLGMAQDNTNLEGDLERFIRPLFIHPI